MAANLLRLGEEINTLDPHCAGFHIDIMDGHFAPNITFGPDMAHAIDAASRNPSWVHLMVDNPTFFVKKLKVKEQSLVSFHIETKINHSEAILEIKEKKYRASLAINPKTAIEKLFPFLNESIDHILIMSVEPGFSGQNFKPEVLQKIPPLIAHMQQHNLSCSIGIDGGISPAIMPLIKQYPITHVAAATSIFGCSDPIAALKNLQ